MSIGCWATIRLKQLLPVVATEQHHLPICYFVLRVPLQNPSNGSATRATAESYCRRSSSCGNRRYLERLVMQGLIASRYRNPHTRHYAMPKRKRQYNLHAAFSNACNRTVVFEHGHNIRGGGLIECGSQ